jgi:hypothetical protein
MKISSAQPHLVPELLLLRHTLATAQTSNRKIITAKPMPKIEVSIIRRSFIR